MLFHFVFTLSTNWWSLLQVLSIISLLAIQIVELTSWLAGGRSIDRMRLTHARTQRLNRSGSGVKGLVGRPIIVLVLVDAGRSIDLLLMMMMMMMGEYN